MQLRLRVACVQVVKDMGGNARTQSISHFPREIDQVVLDLSTYLVEHAPDDGLADVRAVPLQCVSETQCSASPSPC